MDRWAVGCPAVGSPDCGQVVVLLDGPIMGQWVLGLGDEDLTTRSYMIFNIGLSEAAFTTPFGGRGLKPRPRGLL